MPLKDTHQHNPSASSPETITTHSPTTQKTHSPTHNKTNQQKSRATHINGNTNQQQQQSTAASTIAGLTAEQEEEAQSLADNTGIDIEAARNSILQAAKENYAMDSRARGFKADGGIMRLGYQEGSKEPVAKKTMPLLDMDGKEMDLREDGGFVPIGRMEKADDVPARLLSLIHISEPTRPY